MVLPDDGSCWHCGYKLSPQKNTTTEKSQTAARMSWQQTTTAGILNLEALPVPIIVYSGLTVVVIVVALLLLNRLSQPPLLQMSTNNIPPPSWSLITYDEYEFALTLPPNWSYVTVTGDGITKVETLLGDIPYQSEIFLPYSTLTNDLEYLFLAYQENREGTAVLEPFVIVATSKNLNQLSPEQALTLVENSAESLGYDVFRREIVDNANKSHLALGILTAHWRCQGQYINGRTQSMVFALCASPQSYSGNRDVFDQILRNFEYLKRTE